jgi:hypothetical protein
MIGTIKETSTVDGQIKAIVETGSGPAVTVVIMQSGGVDFHPMPGDTVLYEQTGEEINVTAVFSQDSTTAAGEWLAFSRNAAGTVMASIYLKANGEVIITPTLTAKVGTGADFVALAAKVDALWLTLYTLLTTWTPATGDGGLAFKTAALLAFPAPPATVASANLKAD